ncbi:MAG TPA: class I SAM-dependent methyltransferase [Ornithinibacter sp.]|nr:class I SAM-dependent methyltransferase [Ornithinibacter sp.]
MQRHEISRLAHGHHPVMAPLSDASVARLLERLDPPRGGRVLDLGCGSGEWLRRGLTARGDLEGVGVDLHPGGDPADLAAATDGRGSLLAADASAWEGGAFDAVLAVGVAHVFGGPGGTLDAARRHLAPGGRVLLGDGIWDRAPSEAALTALDATADDFPDLAGLVALAGQHGFVPAHGHVSTLEEWDEYEWSWTGSLTDWALADGRDPGERAEALAAATEHRDGWLGGYRGVLGFASLVLVDARSAVSRARPGDG